MKWRYFDIIISLTIGLAFLDNLGDEPFPTRKAYGKIDKQFLWIHGKLSAINLPSATKVVDKLTFSTSYYFSFIYFALVTWFHEPLGRGVGGLIIDLESGWEMTDRKGLQGKQDKGRTESELHKENPQMTYYFPVHEKTKENKLRKSLELEK